MRESIYVFCILVPLQECYSTRDILGLEEIMIKSIFGLLRYFRRIRGLYSMFKRDMKLTGTLLERKPSSSVVLDLNLI